MEQKYNNISVFKSKPTDNPNSPQFSVVIEMADGTKYQGGLWAKTAKSGLNYLSGSLREDTGEQGQKKAAAPAPKQQNDMVDW